MAETALPINFRFEIPLSTTDCLASVGGGARANAAARAPPALVRLTDFREDAESVKGCGFESKSEDGVDENGDEDDSEEGAEPDDSASVQEADVDAEEEAADDEFTTAADDCLVARPKAL